MLAFLCDHQLTNINMFAFVLFPARMTDISLQQGCGFGQLSHQLWELAISVFFPIRGDHTGTPGPAGLSWCARTHFLPL